MTVGKTCSFSILTWLWWSVSPASVRAEQNEMLVSTAVQPVSPDTPTDTSELMYANGETPEPRDETTAFNDLERAHSYPQKAQPVRCSCANWLFPESVYWGVLETEGNFRSAHESGSGHGNTGIHGKLRIRQLIRLRCHDEIVFVQALYDMRQPLNRSPAPHAKGLNGSFV